MIKDTIQLIALNFKPSLIRNVLNLSMVCHKYYIALNGDSFWYQYYQKYVDTRYETDVSMKLNGKLKLAFFRNYSEHRYIDILPDGGDYHPTIMNIKEGDNIYNLVKISDYKYAPILLPECFCLDETKTHININIEDDSILVYRRDLCIMEKSWNKLKEKIPVNPTIYSRSRPIIVYPFYYILHEKDDVTYEHYMEFYGIKCDRLRYKLSEKIHIPDHNIKAMYHYKLLVPS